MGADGWAKLRRFDAFGKVHPALPHAVAMQLTLRDMAAPMISSIYSGTAELLLSLSLSSVDQLGLQRGCY